MWSGVTQRVIPRWYHCIIVYEIGHVASREHRMSHLIALFMFNYASMMSLLLWFQKLEGTNFTTVIRFQPNLLEETIELPVQFQPPIIIASPIESHIQPTYDSRTEYAPSGCMICTTAIVWKGMHSLHNVGSTSSNTVRHGHTVGAGVCCTSMTQE